MVFKKVFLIKKDMKNLKKSCLFSLYVYDKSAFKKDLLMAILSFVGFLITVIYFLAKRI